jgi:hypothetical protein
MPVKYNQDMKARAIRLVREHAGGYSSEYAAITAVAGRLGWPRRRWTTESRSAPAAGSRPA